MVNVLLNGAKILPGDRAGTYRLRHQLGSFRADFGIFGKVSVVESIPNLYFRLALVAAETLFDIGGVLGPALFPIVNDINARVYLHLDDFSDRLSDTAIQSVRIKFASFLSGQQYVLLGRRSG
jgi:hypothetical protein